MNKSLNQRERYVLAGGVTVIGLLLIIFAVIVPYGNAMQRLDNKIISFQERLVETRQLQHEYQNLKNQAGRMQLTRNHAGAVRPLTFLEQTAGRIGGRENLVLMRPQPAVMQGQLRIETTEFKMERLDLDQILHILREVEQAKIPMRIDRLHLKQRFDNATQLDMSATVSAAQKS